jgi:glutamate 5-kinase
VVPVVNENDTVAVAELKFGDNDTLASLIVDLVGADLFVNLTSADGVFDKNPDKNPGAACVSMIEDIESLDIESMCDGKTSVGSGGMYSKLRAARRAAQLGVPTLIVSGKSQLALARIFAGEVVGTLVLPCARLVSHRKFWLAYHDEPAGTVVVDDGAARALRENGKSLLPAGIRAVEGRFERGALVRIADTQGAVLGVGLSNYTASELRRNKGKKELRTGGSTWFGSSFRGHPPRQPAPGRRAVAPLAFGSIPFFFRRPHGCGSVFARIAFPPAAWRMCLLHAATHRFCVASGGAVEKRSRLNL